MISVLVSLNLVSSSLLSVLLSITIASPFSKLERMCRPRHYQMHFYSKSQSKLERTSTCLLIRSNSKSKAFQDMSTLN